MSELVPIQIKLHQKSRLLGIHFAEQTSYQLPYVYGVGQDARSSRQAILL